MEKNKSGDTLNLQEVLESIDKEKSPKLYERTEKLIKAEEVAKNQKIRAEKAEAENKKLKAEAETKTPKKSKGEGTPKKSELSTEDIFTLVEAKVPKDDIEVVKKYAKLNNISIGEALNDTIVKAILKEKAEERKTAEATNTGKGKKGSSKVSDETLLDQVSKGELPEEDIEKAAKARLKQKREGA